MNGADKITPDQIDLVFERQFGHPARTVDKQAVAELGGTVEGFVEFVWDHWLGEPESPTQAQMLKETLDLLAVG